MKFLKELSKVVKIGTVVQITMEIEELKSAGLSELLAGLDDIRIAYLKGYIDGKKENENQSKGQE